MNEAQKGPSSVDTFWKPLGAAMGITVAGTAAAQWAAVTLGYNPSEADIFEHGFGGDEFAALGVCIALLVSMFGGGYIGARMETAARNRHMNSLYVPVEK